MNTDYKGPFAYHGVREYLGERLDLEVDDYRWISVGHLIHPTGEVDILVNETHLGELPPELPEPRGIGALG